MLIEACDKNKLHLPFDAWKLVGNKQAELIKIRLDPGKVIDVHTNPFPVVFYALTGSSTLCLNQKSQDFPAGSSIFIEADADRGIKNSSNKLFEFLVFKLLC